MAPKAKNGAKAAAKPAILKRPAKMPVDDDDDEVVEELEEEEEAEENDQDEEAAIPSSPAVVHPSPHRLSSKSSPSQAGMQALALSPIRPGLHCIEVHYSLEEACSYAAPLLEGLVQLRRRVHRCDATITTGGGARIPVHSLVLASQSSVLDQHLEQNGTEIALGAVSHESADLLVRWMYGELSTATYSPSSTKVNEEVLQLAHQFGLPLLCLICSTCLAAGVTVENVVSRIRLCEDYNLPDLKNALVTALVKDKRALESVSKDAAMFQHPALMRELLALVASKACSEHEQEGEETSDSRPSKMQRV